MVGVQSQKMMLEPHKYIIHDGVDYFFLIYKRLIFLIFFSLITYLTLVKKIFPPGPFF